MTWTGPVRLAVVTPGTGPLEEEGQMLRLGALMALRERQDSQMDLQVEVVVQDSPCSAEEAVTIARRLAADTSICAVVGYLCAETIRAVLPIYEEAGLPLINPTVSADYIRTDQSHHLFPLLYTDSEQSAFLAAYTKKALGCNRAAVLGDESVYGQTLKASFVAEAERDGLEIVAEVSVGADRAGVSRAVRLLQDANPEAIFLAAHPRNVRGFLLERHRQHLGNTVLGPDRLADLDFYETAGPTFEGVLLCQPILLDTNDNEVSGFVKRFSQLNHRWPDWIAAVGYDGARLALEALDRSGPGRDRLVLSLRAMSGLDTSFCSLSGPLFFRADGTCQRPLYVATYQQGRLLPADPPSVEFGFTAESK
jgi:branched-chain amino acid transport system substrate-binding protein